MDVIIFNERDKGRVINKIIYLSIGLNKNGYKQVLGIWVGKAENSHFK
jgi:putative transposase